MNDFYKQDVFFFVTTIAVVVLTLVAVTALIFLIKILKDISYISKKAKEETGYLAEDLKELRNNVKTQGFKLRHLFGFFSSFYKRRKKQ